MYKIADTMQALATLEQLKFIKLNSKYGDKVLISKALGLPYSTVEKILQGRFEGENGKTVIRYALKLISDRARLEKLEAKKVKESLKKLIK